MIRTSPIVVLLSMILQGCMYAPGQNLDTGKIVREGTSGSTRVELIQITPKLIAMEEASTIPPVIPGALTSFVPPDYKIGANDVLFITVWDHPELTAPSGPQQQLDANGRLVRPDGKLFYPYIGNVDAAGKTLEELRGYIAEKLARFIDSPQVDVSMLRFASQKFVVSGAVLHAGPIPVTSTNMSVLEAMGTAGIDPLNADLSGLTLTRDGKIYKLDLDALNHDKNASLGHVYLKDGDQLYLPYNDRKRIYVMGEVIQPHAVSFKTKTMNLSDVLSTAGGLNQATSNGDAIYVIRGVENLEKEPAKVFQLEASSPTAMALATRFDVQPQDVVYIGPASVTRWNRFISQLVPSASLVGIGAAARNDMSEASSR